MSQLDNIDGEDRRDSAPDAKRLIAPHPEFFGGGASGAGVETIMPTPAQLKLLGVIAYNPKLYQSIKLGKLLG